MARPSRASEKSQSEKHTPVGWCRCVLHPIGEEHFWPIPFINVITHSTYSVCSSYVYYCIFQGEESTTWPRPPSFGVRAKFFVMVVVASNALAYNIHVHLQYRHKYIYVCVCLGEYDQCIIYNMHAAISNRLAVHDWLGICTSDEREFRIVAVQMYMCLS